MTLAAPPRPATAGPDGETPGHRRLFRQGHPGLVLTLILVCQLMVVLDATIVNIALHDIKDALGFSSASLSWVINAYTLTFGGLLLLGARAGDILGRRQVFLGGIAVFTLASLAGGFAQNSGELLAARAAAVDSTRRRTPAPGPDPAGARSTGLASDAPARAK